MLPFNIFLLKKYGSFIMQQIFHPLNTFCTKILKFPICSICYQDIMKKKYSHFGRTHDQGLFHHGSEVQINNSMLICVNMVKKTLHSNCTAIFHTYISQGVVQHYGPRIIYIYYWCGFHKACCDCKSCSLISIKRYIPLTKFF